MAIDLALNPRLDVTALALEYATHGRVQVRDVLAPTSATALHALLRARSDWRQVLNSGDRLVELDRATRAALPEAQARALDDAVYAGARGGFQYRFETLRVPDEADVRLASDDPLARFATWWSEGEPRAFLRTVTGEPAIAFADTQATAYAPGDFLTGHDDAFEGKHRLAAYVLGLNPTWRPEWGGLLLFHEGEGRIEGVSPGFNTLSLFRVGQMHSVSEVTRAAAYRRYSITGWLRARPAR